MTATDLCLAAFQVHTDIRTGTIVPTVIATYAVSTGVHPIHDPIDGSASTPFRSLGVQDWGQNPGVRPWTAMAGCNIYGRVSRWPISAAGAVTGPEAVLLDTSTPDQHGRDACVQFATHSTPTCIVAAPDGGFYIAFGDGAAFTAPDWGQMGTTGGVNEGGCNDNAPYTGAFRTQDPQRLNGAHFYATVGTFVVV